MSGSGPDTLGEHLRIWLLGGFRVAVGAKEIAPAQWRLRKARSLVKLLALASGHRLHREQLMEALWPDLEPEAASNNLRKTLHHARRVLSSAAADPVPYLRFENDLLGLAPAGQCWVDVDAFEHAAGDARRNRSAGAYRAALDYYSGDLLPEDRYEDWTGTRRETLRTAHFGLLSELAALYERERDLTRAIEIVQHLLTRDAGHEDAHRSLMRLYALTGQRQQALRQYQLLRETISREFETGPDASSQQLYQDIVAGRFPVPGTVKVEPAA